MAEDLPAIRIYGDPVLRAISEPVENIDGDVVDLVERMFRVMGAAAGIGLAAPQVGVGKQVFVARMPFEGAQPLALLNPEIVEGESPDTDEEGCLSVPEIRGDVTRPSHIIVKGVTLQGDEVRVEAEGLMARVIQHEMDHLNGVLFVDRLGTAAKFVAKRKLKKISHRYSL